MVRDVVLFSIKGRYLSVYRPSHSSLSAESRLSSDNEDAVHERRYGKFTGTLQLPQGVAQLDELSYIAGDIKALMDASVLKVTFPMNSTEAAPKKDGDMIDEGCSSALGNGNVKR